MEEWIIGVTKRLRGLRGLPSVNVAPPELVGVAGGQLWVMNETPYRSTARTMRRRARTQSASCFLLCLTWTSTFTSGSGGMQ
ncbi:hypothetical protein WG66_001368 [Moniliophthora roreri]|nr:hypothetical protein WG66_001368 [Moniliophthora roreri]